MAGIHQLWIEEDYEIVNFWDTPQCVEKDDNALR
jgi:hypothetical protein